MNRSWVYPEKCALCGRLGEDPICPTCESEMASAKLPEAVDGPDPVTVCASVYEYAGRPAQAVRRLKYNRVMTHAGRMSKEIAELVVNHELGECDAFVPVPIHWTRVCERGFNQAEVLCESLTNVKTNWLKRKRRTRQQVGLTPEMRRVNLQGAFLAPPEVRDRWLVLVDDVTTSGGTGRECAKALLASGAYRVDLVTYCRGGAISDS